jgi:hypothetical protein
VAVCQRISHRKGAGNDSPLAEFARDVAWSDISRTHGIVFLESDIGQGDIGLGVVLN